MKNDREFILHTGISGVAKFNRAMEEVFWGTQVEDLLKTKAITEEEHDTIVKMLGSPDPESFKLGVALIEVKQEKDKKDGRIIYSRKSQIPKRKSR